MKIKNFLVATLAAVLGMVGISGMMVSNAEAQILCANGKPEDSYDKCPEWSKDDNAQGIASQKDLMGTLNTIINVIVGVVGFVSVAMIVVGGISFATSQGDTAKTTKARNTILYGVVGLVVAMLAFAIVNFVLGNVFGGSSS